LVKKHLELWTENDSAKRLKLAGRIYAENIRVIDPEIILNGQIEVSDFIGRLLEQHPGFKFKMVNAVETHHNTALLSWKFGPTSKPETITGTDIFTIADNKIANLLVFVNGVTK